MILTPMTDYVLSLNKPGMVYLTAMDNCVKYAQFLKQPLTLGMFVPCLPSGEPFNAFQMDCLENENSYHELRKAYNEAKERVLFKGFEIDNGFCRK